MSPEEFVDLVRRIPARFRCYDTLPDEAERAHRVGPDLQKTLLDAGLPHQGTGADLRFFSWDLRNAAVAFGLPAPTWMSVRLSARPFGRLEGSRVAYRARIAARCPHPEQTHTCTFTPAVSYEQDVELDAGPLHLREALGELVETAQSLRYLLLPLELAEDVGFAREHRAADCRGATRYLVHVAEQAGIAARSCGGYLMNSPFPLPHGWIEVRHEGAWVPADPFYLSCLARMGLVDPAVWPVDRSPRGLLWKLSESTSELPLIAHDGQTVAATVRIAGKRVL